MVRSPRIDATTVQTTVRIPNAQTAILAGAAQKARSDKELVIIVTPHVIGPEEAKQVRMPAFGRGKSTASGAGLAGSAAAAQEAKALVASFLEAFRKGDNNTATKLLTKVARQKAEETGRSVALAVNDSARFEVDDAVYPTPKHDIAHVPTKWIDRDEAGKLRTDKATWICRQEPEGWRIVGVAAYVFEGEDPLLLSFEDPDDMAKKQNWLKEEIERRASQKSPATEEKKAK